MTGDGSPMPKLAQWFTDDIRKGRSYDEVRSLIDGLMHEGVTDEGLVSALKGLADRDDPDAQYALGIAYWYGFGTGCSEEKACGCYERAIVQGHALAMFEMGVHYMLGIGVQMSSEKALGMLKRASCKGVAEASKEIAWMYGIGYGVEKSETESFRWTL